ncbi:MAG TPA: hypothetical protein VFS77_03370, partial [Pyrinomonadaceae bacterium]|nr:hypothetical protein [Pyrinomonadaceae bacterium]
DLCANLCPSLKLIDLLEEVMADDNVKTCKNPACTCPPQEGGKYCSASCEGSGDTIELDCDCGHDACGGNF